MTKPESEARGSQVLLSHRAALILALGVCCGLAVGALTSLAGGPVPAAVIAALFAAGSSTVGLNSLIGPRKALWPGTTRVRESTRR